MNKKCPASGAAEVLHDTREVPYTYKGQTTTFPALSGDFCPACGEILLDAAEADRFGAAVRAFNKQVARRQEECRRQRCAGKRRLRSIHALDRHAGRVVAIEDDEQASRR